MSERLEVLGNGVDAWEVHSSWADVSTQSRFTRVQWRKKYWDERDMFAV